jgi:hypothetical protein
MALWIFEAKLSYDTQFLFRTLMFTVGENGNLELPAPGPAPTHHESIYGEATYYPVDPSTTSASGGVCSGLNPYAGSYTPTAML